MRSLGIMLGAALVLVPVGAFAVQRAGSASAGGARLAQFCHMGGDDVAGLPADRLQAIVSADEAKKAALDELAKAAQKAGQDIDAACMAPMSPTAPGRLAAMQKRIEAMIAAAASVQPTLERFFDLLSDEEREQVIAASEKARQGRAASLLDRDCGSAQPSQWPAARIDRTVHPSEAQRASLAALQDAAAKATDMLATGCTPEDFLTPTVRLAAVGKRLGALLQAVKTVGAPLDDFYASLSAEQKAKFDAISLPQTAQVEHAKVRPVSHHHRFVSFGYFVRRFFHLF
jgi:hypothetical protein